MITTEHQVPTVTQPNSSQSPERRPGPTRVLVIDDSATVRHSLRTYLESHGYEVETSDNPITVPFLVGRFDPDVLLLDVEMPGLSGDRVCAIARGQGAQHEVRVVFHSSIDEAELKDLVQEAQADGYYPKREAYEGLVGFLRKLTRQR